MTPHTEGPIFSATAKRGNQKFWRPLILQDGSHYFIATESWQSTSDGSDSVHVTSTPYEVTAKNVGKQNETTPEHQAMLELQALIRKQRTAKGYVMVGEKPSETVYPMLATKYEGKRKITFPAFIQRKYNGTRMLFDGVRGMSRGGKDVIPEVIQHLQFETGGKLLDGELILPDNVLLQTTLSATKKYHPDISPNLRYYVYDLVAPNLPFYKRWDALQLLFASHSIPSNVILVETIEAQTEAEMQRYHALFIRQGYEGTIIRSKMGIYLAGARSQDLQKYKDFQDEEFRIVGVEDGGGLFKGCAIFVCETAEGKQFRSTPEGSLDHKRKLYEDREALIGKWLTVRFFDKTQDGIPTINVGVAVRDYE